MKNKIGLFKLRCIYQVLENVRYFISLMVIVSILISSVFSPSIAATLTLDEDSNEPSVVFLPTENGTIQLYKKSYALLIGISEYEHGWTNLPGVEEDLTEVQKTLESHGFEVIKVTNPDSQELRQAYDSFIAEHGMDFENRLLFYFSGHGHTEELTFGEKMGYIIPSDVPLPADNKRAFVSNALSMQEFEVYSKKIQSKHALFIFDSCFSGSIFYLSRSAPSAIGYKTQEPVRQFITSGRADEKVPDKSIFREQLVAGLNGASDLDQDGFVTGSELGLFLENKVTIYSKNSQHPQYGKIRNPHLDKGDLVFQVDHLSFRLSVSPLSKKQEESNAIWHISAISLALTSAILSRSEATKYNELIDENEDLKAQLNGMTGLDEYNSLQSQYNTNQDDAAIHKRNVQILDVVTLGAVLWEGYLIYSYFAEKRSKAESDIENLDKVLRLHPQPRPNKSPLLGLTYSHKW